MNPTGGPGCQEQDGDPASLLTLAQKHLLTRMPAACALALALRDCGLSTAEISWWLGLPLASMPTLFSVSTARLAALEDGADRRVARVTESRSAHGGGREGEVHE